MRLDFNALMLIKPDITRKGYHVSKSEAAPVKSPSKNTIDQVISALKKHGAMNVSQIVDATEISQAAIYRAVNRMVDKGIAEAIKVERECRRSTTHFNLKGVDLDLVSSGLYPIKKRVMQHNNKSGLIGVHFHKSSDRWFSTFRKTKPISFNNLLDAACKRKSLELTDGLI